MAQTHSLTAAVLSFAAACSWAAEPELANLPFDVARAQRYQQQCAASLDTPQEITNSLGIKLVLIPPGCFTMGPNGSTYRVTIRKPFYMGVTEVTLGQYRKYKADN